MKHVVPNMYVCGVSQKLDLASDLAWLGVQVHSKFNSIEIYGGWTHTTSNEEFSRARVFLYVEWKENREAGLGEGGVNTMATFLACCVPYLFLCASIC